MTTNPPHDPLAKFRYGSSPAASQPSEATEDGDGLPLPDAPVYVPWRATGKPQRLALYCLGDMAYTLAYSQLIQGGFNAQGGQRVSLVFHHAHALITGRHLQPVGPLVNALKLGFLQAYDPQRWPAPGPDEPCIDSIVFKPVASIPGLEF